MINMIVVICPHCEMFVYIEQINCGIFRHAVHKHTNEPINPHSSQQECERLLRENLVYGCAKPFRILTKDDTYITEICDYI